MEKLFRFVPAVSIATSISPEKLANEDVLAQHISERHKILQLMMRRQEHGKDQ